MVLLDDLMKLEQVFAAQMAEEPAIAPDIHRIHFSYEQLRQHRQTLYAAQQAIEKAGD